MRYGSWSLYSCESHVSTESLGQRWPACIASMAGCGPGCSLCCRGRGEYLGCGLKTRNKPAQRQRGQHKDIFPCITQQRACSTVTHTNPDLVKETWSLFCIACFGFRVMALLVSVMNCLLGVVWRAVPILTLSYSNHRHEFSYTLFSFYKNHRSKLLGRRRQSI